MTSSDEVLSFWFGEPGTPEHGTACKAWFTRSPTFDEEIRRRFAAMHAAAVEGGLEDWEGEPRSTLALIIVLDQFSRNLHRDSARAFDGDARALALARWTVSATWDTELTPLEREFVYMPYAHSESPEMQEEAVRLFGKLAQYPETRDLQRWAEAHARIIERFGRFPHRNAVLGRPSTPEEIAFLKELGSSF